MKKKKQKKSPEENPNQLSFDFLLKDQQTDIQFTKSPGTIFNIQLNTAKRLAIQLADG